MNNLVFRNFVKEATAKVALEKHTPSTPAAPVSNKLNNRELSQVFRQMANPKQKTAGLPGGKLIRPNVLHNLDHVNEIAGLGTLAVPSAMALSGNHMSDNAEHGMELAGLGMLAAPYAGRLAGAASPRLGNWATGMWNRAMTSGMANRVLGAV